jgi:hypothetical protein
MAEPRDRSFGRFVEMGKERRRGSV